MILKKYTAFIVLSIVVKFFGLCSTTRAMSSSRKDIFESEEYKNKITKFFSKIDNLVWYQPVETARFELDFLVSDADFEEICRKVLPWLKQCVAREFVYSVPDIRDPSYREKVKRTMESVLYEKPAVLVKKGKRNLFFYMESRLVD